MQMSIRLLYKCQLCCMCNNTYYSKSSTVLSYVVKGDGRKLYTVPLAKYILIGILIERENNSSRKTL